MRCERRLVPARPSVPSAGSARGARTPRRSYPGVGSAALSLTLFAGVVFAPARAEAQTRVAIVIQEVDDGTPRTRSELEAALSERLSKDRGVVLVEEDQLVALRRAAGEGSTAMLAVITSDDADLLIEGNAELAPLKNKLFPKLTGYEARAALRIYATDSGQNLGTVRVSAQAPGNLSAMNARSDVVTRLAEQAVSAIRTQYPDALRRTSPRRINVRLQAASPISTSEVQTALATLQTLPPVAEAHVMTQRRKVAQLSVTVQDRSQTSDLALEIETAGTSLVVVGHSSREVVVELDPRRGVKLPLRVRSFGRSSRARLVQDFATEALLGLGFLEPAKDKSGPSGPALELTGKVLGSGRGELGVRLSAKLRPRGGGVASVRGSCHRRAFAGCVTALTGRLARDVEARRSSIQSSRPVPGLQVLGLETPGVFPGRLGHYARFPFATVVVRNPTDEDLDGVVTRVWLPGFADTPTESAPVDVPAGQEARIPVRAVFDRARLGAQSRTEQSLATIQVEYGLGPLRRITRTKRPVVVYERHAMVWRADQGESIAGFIDGHAPGIQSIATSVQAELSGLEDPFAVPVAVTEALRSLAYARDPKSPFDPARLDFVRFPDETLSVGRGDCDDLSVAFASLVEAVGGSAILLLLPSHVLVAVGTGLPPDMRPALSIDDGATVRFGGQVYIPVEATHLKAGFPEAWAAAQRRLRSASMAPTIIDVAQARARYPAATLGRDEGAQHVPDIALERVKATLDELSAARVARVRSRADAFIRQGTPNALGEAGTLLAQMGDLEAARPLLLRATAQPDASARFLNNLGNVELIKGAPADALRLYERVLAASPELRAVRINAVIAAMIGKASDRLDEHLLELSPDDLRRLWRRIQGGGVQPAAADLTADAFTAQLLGADGVDWPRALHWL